LRGRKQANITSRVVIDLNMWKPC